VLGKPGLGLIWHCELRARHGNVHCKMETKRRDSQRNGAVERFESCLRHALTMRRNAGAAADVNVRARANRCTHKKERV